MKYAFFIISSILSLSGFGAAAALGSAETSVLQGDNTQINQRDKKSTEVTASQQTSGEMDLYLVSRIRQDLINQKDLSVYAKNVKIISLDGQVTLKGPVRSRDEAMTVLKFARAAAGVPNVINEISVVPETK